MDRTAADYVVTMHRTAADHIVTMHRTAADHVVTMHRTAADHVVTMYRTAADYVEMVREALCRVGKQRSAACAPAEQRTRENNDEERNIHTHFLFCSFRLRARNLISEEMLKC